MDAPPHIQRAAKRAAAMVEAMLVQMLMANERGDVVVEVGYSDLTPIRRVTDRRTSVKVPRGQSSNIDVT